MRDPVILPTSKAIIDRSTIKSHLLSDITDPFNRKPLKIEEVIPGECIASDEISLLTFVAATELKVQIDNFVKERRQKMAASKGDKDIDDPMSE